MKKILSLLSMLMITVTAFATSYTDKLTYKLTVFTALTKDLPAGELTIEPYGTSNYTVTAKGCDLSDFDAGNWDEIVCEDVAGTTDANGVTTITLENPYAYRTSDNTSFSSTKLVVKFNGTKAYAHFEGKIKIGLALRAFEYTFGTDEGFGGGSTGGGEVKEDYYINFDKSTKNTHSSRYSTSVSLQQVGKDKQTISFNSTKDGYEDLTASKFTVEAGSEVTPSIGYVGEWMHGYVYIDLDNNKQFSFNAESDDQTGTDVVSYSFYTTATGEAAANGKNSKGETVASNCNVNPLPSFTAPATPGTYRIRFKVDWNNIDAGGGVAVGQNICANGGGIWDATLEVVAPAPTVDKEVPFTGVTLSASNGVTGTADVTFKEMSDNTVQMTFNGAGYGISATNLTKGTDTKGRTTYTGEAVNDAASTVTYTVNAVVYSEDATQKLYMTMVSVDGTKFTVGEDPDYVAPEPEIEGTVVEGSKNYAANGSKFEWSNIAINWNKQKLVAVIDLSSCTGTSENILSVGQNIGSWSIGGWHFYYTVASKKMKSDYLATDGAHPVSDPKTGVEPGTVRIELSKAEGCTINGVSYNALYDSSVTGTWQSNTEDFWNLTSVNIGSKEGANRSNAVIKYVTVVDLPVTVKEEKTFNEALYMVQGTTSSKLADATVEVKEMSDKTINMSLKYMETEYTSTELTKGTDDKNRTTYTGKVSNGSQTYDVAGVVYKKDNAERLYMTMTAAGVTLVVGENPDAVTPDPGVTEESNKTYTSNLRILDGETTVVEEAEANVNIIKYSDESYKVTLKNVNMLNKTQDLVFVGKALIEEAPTEATEPLTIIAKSDAATTEFFGEEMSATFEITEVSAEEIKMGFVLNNTSLEYQGEFNYTEEETPEVYTNNLHIYDAAAPETDLFQADQAKVEFLATATGGFKLTLKDVTLNEKTQDLVFTGTLPTPQPGGQDPLAEEGETTPAEPAMVLNATADEATATFLGATSATAVFNVIMNDEAETENDAFALTFTITAGKKTLGGEFNYEKQDTPDEKYPVNFDKTAKSTHSSRALNSFSLQQTGKDKQTESVYASKAAYEDHTSKVFTVEAGSELTASFDYTGEWMHSFVYIDFDNDGQFSYKEGQWDQTGTDLVAFSFYSLDSNPKNDASGYNSVGDELTGDARNTYAAPSFKAPAKAGEYRIRFKFDWNCILPGGSSSILSDGGGVWDATLKVVEPVVDGISSINAEVANGETQLFTVNGVKLNKLQKGLNIVRTADGKVKKVLVK